jgi:XcyI-like restriction endonuclease
VTAKTDKKGALIPGTETLGLSLNPPSPARQVRFYQLLIAARRQWFMDALSEALGRLDQNSVKEQIREYVPGDAQKILAAAGLRDEYVFPIPAIIEAKPSLIGYYRLLLGAPQKSFYKSSTGMGRFKNMELGTMSKKSQILVPEFCRAMAKPLAELVRQIPKITDRDLSELQLLTFGSQLQGSRNTQIGKTAMKDVFVAVKEIVAKYTVAATDKKLTLKNSAGRTVFINLSHDPDVCVEEQVGDRTHHSVAIEVKGGTDVSNATTGQAKLRSLTKRPRRRAFLSFGQSYRCMAWSFPIYKLSRQLQTAGLTSPRFVLARVGPGMTFDNGWRTPAAFH